MNTGDIFHPLAWSPREAHQFLQEIPIYDECGLLALLRNWWRQRSRPRVSVTLDSKKGGALGMEALLEFRMGLALGDETLTEEEVDALLRSQGGLFPQPGEISFQCNCPDWADMCKHIAAVMYGIGARLDEEPELLFLLRGVDREELITADAAASEIVGKGSKRSRRRSLADKDLASVFDVELEERSEKAAKRKGTKGKATKKVAAKKKSVKRKSASSGASKRSSKKKGAKRAPASFRPSAAAVARLRRRLGMSKIEFASAVGVSSATVTKWEGASGTIRPNGKGLAGLNRLHRGQE